MNLVWIFMILLFFTSECILIIRKVKHTANGFSTHDVTLQPFLLEEEVPFELELIGI